MVAPRVTLPRIAVLRAILGFLAGGLVFGVVVLVGRRLPIQAVPPRAPTTAPTAPGLRLAVTLAAVAAVAFSRMIRLPFIDPEAKVSLFALGVVPIVAGFIVVEIVALVVPRWRPLRHGARVELTLHSIAVGLGIALLEGYSVARVLQDMQVVGEGIGAALLVAATLVGESVCMLVLAALVGRYGLGNGLALVIIADLTFRIPLSFDRLVGRTPFVAQAALFGIVVLTAWALRRRMGGAVRLPSAGAVPIAYGFVTLVLAAFRVDDPFPRNVDLWVVLVVLASIVFTWLFWVGRAGPPAVLAASLVSAAYLLAIGGLASLASEQAGWTATLVALATAEALDLVDAWRGTVPEPEGGHVRSLLHFFAPWA